MAGLQSPGAATSRLSHKFRCGHLQQLRSQGSDLVVVRPTLQCWKDSNVDALLDVWDRLCT